eukprot:snap_masked-scaffold_1-processed-gene-30.37-mRNA-1 protein AED:0.19 eAED:0.19 QI:0/0/0/1/1/1/4/0/927
MKGSNSGNLKKQRTVFLVAEKPSIAKSFADALCTSAEKCNTIKNGRLPPVHIFQGKFKNKTVTFRVSSVAGHLFSCDFPTDYQNWERTDPEELFEAKVEDIPVSKGMLGHIRGEGKKADYILLCLDCDREGENIAYEVLSLVYPEYYKSLVKNYSANQNFKDKNPLQHKIFRAKFSALASKDLRKSIEEKNLVQPNIRESLSVTARQELDLKIGVAFSRFQTQYLGNKFFLSESKQEANNNTSGYKTQKIRTSSVVSYGPCQFPTLFFCVKRTKEIESFKPKTFYTLQANLSSLGNVKAQWTKNRIFSKHEINNLYKAFDSLGGDTVEVSNLSTKKKFKSPPGALNTVALLKAASTKLAMAPIKAMHLAESLYLSGNISYPRTETTKYPASIDPTPIIKQFQQDTGRVFDTVGKVNSGKDVGDHPPITPMGFSMGLYASSSEQGSLYRLIVDNFVASWSVKAVFESTKISVKHESESSFSFSATRVIKLGYLAALGVTDGGYEEDEEEESTLMLGSSAGILSNLQVGTQLPAAISIKEGQTKPPPLLTESELIGLMEKNGIGTDASIPTHINNIISRGYAEVGGAKRQLIPTKLGLALINSYLEVNASLVEPRVRADIEKQCDLIATGKLAKNKVVGKVLNIFRSKFQEFKANANKLDKVFERYFPKMVDRLMDLEVSARNSATGSKEGKPWSRHGVTGRYLIFLQRPDRLFDRAEEKNYPLPKGGSFSESNGVRCAEPDCNFEISYFSVGDPIRTFPICPNCYSKQEDINSNEYLSWSPHPKTHKLITSRQVSSDPFLIADCKKKHIFLNPEGKTLYSFPKSLLKSVEVASEVDGHGNHMLRVVFGADAKAKQANLVNKEVNGYLRDEPLWSLLYNKEATNTNKGTMRAKYRKGRGRGRGGKGRGGKSSSVRGRGSNHRGRGAKRR